MRIIAYPSEGTFGEANYPSIQLLWNRFGNIEEVEGLLLRRLADRLPKSMDLLDLPVFYLTVIKADSLR